MSPVTEIYSVATVRAIDNCAINVAGIAGYELMTRAANASLAQARVAFPDANHWQIACGAGNNAGDGYVLARLASRQGIPVSVVAVASPDTLTGDAATAYADFQAEGGQYSQWDGSFAEDADLLVDGLLGTGLCRPLDGLFADAVAAANAHSAPVLALDIPTGIHGDSGEVLGTAICANLTVTFVGLKAGLFLRDGLLHAGDVHLADLDIPEDCRVSMPVELRRIGSELLRSKLPPRKKDAHKGDFGHVVAVGGGPGMPGAISLCGQAALRAGAGRVTIATHPEHHAEIAASRPELMCRGVTTADELIGLLDQATTLVVGPGLGQSEWSETLFSAVMNSNLPVVVDADALNLLGKSAFRRPDWVLTPHPGEAARLLGSSAATVQENRRQSLKQLQDEYGGTIVLKGAGSLISSAIQTPWLSTSGNPGMSSPGMGDVLAGIIGAFLAQGLDAELAAAIGVEIHARAGDRAATHGERGLIAGDLLDEVRILVNP